MQTESTNTTPCYVRECSLPELTQIQIDIESLMKDWFEDDIRLNFSTLAIVEVLANIFEHGFSQADLTRAEVVLSISRNKQTIIASIVDNAAPTPNSAIQAMAGTHNQMPATNVSQELLPDSGWGLNLIQHAAKSIKYKRSNNSNYLELTFDGSIAS